MIRKLTAREMSVLEPELRELSALDEAARQVEEQRRGVEARVQRICSLMVEDGEVVDVAAMEVIRDPELPADNEPEEENDG